MGVTPKEKLFIEEIGRRVPPLNGGTVVRTRRGEVVLTQSDKGRLDLIARRDGMDGAADLVNFYLPS